MSGNTPTPKPRNAQEDLAVALWGRTLSGDAHATAETVLNALKGVGYVVMPLADLNRQITEAWKAGFKEGGRR